MKERDSDRKRIGLDWASKFGDRNLTIGKSRLESLVQSKTQLREIREKRELLWEKRKTNWEWRCSVLYTTIDR